MNKIIHQVHFGKLSVKQAEWRRRLMELNPDCEHLLWTEENVASLGVDLPGLRKDYLGNDGASNVIRLKAVLDHGGLFVESDVEPLEPFTNLMVYAACAARQEPERLCNAIFGAEKGHPWVKWQFERYHYNRGIPAYWGVELMSSAPREGVLILPREIFYPFLWDAPVAARVPHEGSLCMKHWEGSK